MEIDDSRVVPIAERNYVCTLNDLGRALAYRWQSPAVQCIRQEMNTHPEQLLKFIRSANAIAGSRPGTYNLQMNDIGGVEIVYRGNKESPAPVVPDGAILAVVEPAALVNRLADDLNNNKLDDAAAVIKDEMARYPYGPYVDLISNANAKARGALGVEAIMTNRRGWPVVIFDRDTKDSKLVIQHPLHPPSACLPQDCYRHID